ncbi:MAG: S-layer homology domain-containing protein [Bacillaceae bacterium]|nr:S-layer homology domain-containing protein [Bacillaceae bacterium]
MKKMMILSLVLALFVQLAGGLAVEANGVKLSDVDRHWAKNQVNQAIQLGFIQGYPDQTFRPDHNITRAEFTKSLVVALQIQQSANESVFVDDNNWAEGYIQAAIGSGIVKTDEYPGLKFEPNKNITRREIAVMTVRALGMEADAENRVKWEAIDSDLKDLHTIDEDWRGYVKIANDLGIVLGYPDETFGPEKKATRAEAVVMVLRTLDRLSEQSQPQPVEGEDVAEFSQAEFMKMLVDAMGYTETEPVEEVEGHWAEEYYQKAQAAGILDVVDVDPDGDVTVEDAATLIIKALGYRDNLWGKAVSYKIITREEYDSHKNKVISETDAVRYIENMKARIEVEEYGEQILQELVESLDIKDGVVSGYLPKVKEGYTISLEWTYFDGPSWSESNDREFKELYGERFGRGGVKFEADGTKGYLGIMIADIRGGIAIIDANIYLPNIEVKVWK